MENKRISPLKAIRLKCLDCCCNSSNEVKLCAMEKCPLYPFREGRNPNIPKREYTEEQRREMRARGLKAAERLNGKAGSPLKSENSPSEGRDTTL